MKNKYEIRGDITAIFINYKGRTLETIIDTEDLEIVSEHPNSWILNNYGYVYGRERIKGGRLHHLLHRVIMKTDPDMQVDHINNNPLINTKSNLRNVTHQQNMQNIKSVKKNKSGGIRGVFWVEKSNKFLATVQDYRIGFFDTAKEAEEAVKIARAKFMPFSKEAELINTDGIENVFHNKHLSQPRSNNTSGYRNVFWHKDNKKWSVVVRGKHIGYTDDLEKAAKMAEEARAKRII